MGRRRDRERQRHATRRRRSTSATSCTCAPARWPTRQPPSAPGRPAVTNGVFTSLAGGVVAGGDDRVVSAYEIYANGTLVARGLGRSTSATVTGLAGSKPTSDHGARPRRRPQPVPVLAGRPRSRPAPAPPALPKPAEGVRPVLPGQPEPGPRHPQRHRRARRARRRPARPRDVQVTGVGGVPATGVSMVALNVTVTAPSAPGFLTVYPAARRRRRPRTSTSAPARRCPTSCSPACRRPALVERGAQRRPRARAGRRRRLVRLGVGPDARAAKMTAADAGAGARHPPARLRQGRPGPGDRRAGGGGRLGRQRRRAQRDGHRPDGGTVRHRLPGRPGRRRPTRPT